MKVIFSMDGIKNMDQLYTWTTEYDEAIGCEGKVKHYHGVDYCKSIVEQLTSWKKKNYSG